MNLIAALSRIDLDAHSIALFLLRTPEKKVRTQIYCPHSIIAAIWSPAQKRC